MGVKESDYFKKESFPPVGVIGRLYRLITAGLQAAAFYYIIINWSFFTSSNFPGSYLYVGLQIYFLIGINILINDSFGRSHSVGRRRPQAALLLLWAAVVGYSWATTGVYNGPAVTTFGAVLGLYYTLHLGIGFILATLLGTPGGPMRSIPQLWGILTGNKSKAIYCTGFFDNVDKWEFERGARKKAAL